MHIHHLFSIELLFSQNTAYVYIYSLVNLKIFWICKWFMLGGRRGTREPSSVWEYSYSTLYITQGYFSQRLALPHQTLSSLSNFLKAETLFLHCWIRAEVSLFHRRPLCWQTKHIGSFISCFSLFLWHGTETGRRLSLQLRLMIMPLWDHVLNCPRSLELEFGSYYYTKTLSLPTPLPFSSYSF